jgi:hypothetical protein
MTRVVSNPNPLSSGSMILTAGLIVLVVALTACQPGTPTVETIPLPTSTRLLDDHEKVERFLNCEDCLDGELDAVLELGDRANPILIDYLVSGPSPETLQSVERGLRESYSQMAEYAKIQEDRTLQPRQSQEAFVSNFLENLVAQYQTRSVRAIVLIGDEEAVEKASSVLEEQLARTKREDLRTLLQQSLRDLK